MKRFWHIFCVLLILWGSTYIIASPLWAQEEDVPLLYQAEAEALWAEMSPAARVGQLFVVTVEGSEIEQGDPLHRLITDYQIGGVVLLAVNDNFAGGGDLPPQVTQLTNSAQQLALTGAIERLETDSSVNATQPTEPITDTTPTPTPTPLPPIPPEVPVPLFIATQQLGNGRSELQRTYTEIPTQLAIGATWRTDRAEAVGEIIGAELAASGFNLLLGPSLDLLDTRLPEAAEVIGTGSFGGDPYWVGRLGQAYVSGVRGGSDGRMAIMPTGFPGSGARDRSSQEEIATVRKSLLQLVEADLQPYLTVVSMAEQSRIPAVDGLMTTHLRYQGFQGSIRASTAPVSLDPQALQSLVALPELDQWRNEGGLLMSDSLGVEAIQRFYSNTGTEFPHRQVAKDALLAGNDLLFVASFGAFGSDYETQIANVQDTITWFEERYETDQAFQQRVDDAVIRILQTKLRLYEGDFSTSNVLVPAETLVNLVGQGEPVMFDVAQDAVTLLSPTTAELIERLPSPPTSDQKLVIFTDVYFAQQCTDCQQRPIIDVLAIERGMLDLYGPTASEQIRGDQIDSFSFADLSNFMQASLPIPEPVLTPTVVTSTETISGTFPFLERPPAPPVEFVVQEALAEASWVIVALTGSGNQVEENAFQQLLAERADLLRDKQLIAFSFGAPTDLDTTEISKLTAYFGMYSASSSFIDAAVRTIFRDLTPRGASPISLDSLGYDLQAVTAPDPDQVIELFIVENEELFTQAEEGPLDLRPGDTVRLETGVILDQNGRLVPDGTPVQFTQEDRVQGFFNVIAEVTTIEGRATFDYVLEARPGQFRLRAAAGEATASQEVDIAIGENEDASVVVITPTPAPTETPTPTPTATPTETPTPTPTPTPMPTPVVVTISAEPQIRSLLVEVQMLLSLMSGAIIVIILGSIGRFPPQIRFRRVLWLLILALGGYIYFMLDLPGVSELPPIGNWVGGAILVTLGGAGAVLLTLGRLLRRSRT